MKTILRRFGLLFVILSLALLSACSSIEIMDTGERTVIETNEGKTPNLGIQTSNPTPVFLGNRQDQFTTTEFGEMHTILVNEGPFGVYIRYPQSDNNTEVDRIIASWASAAYDDAIEIFEAILIDDEDARGEFNIQFDSFIIHEHFASVIGRGFFAHNHLAHPYDIIEIFNFDTELDKLLTTDEILDFEQIDFILEILKSRIIEEMPSAEAFLINIDSSWLNYLAIVHDGLLVILPRTEFLPSYMGTLEILLPYSELGDFFLLWEVELEKQEDTPDEELEIIEGPIVDFTPTPIQLADIDPSRPVIAITFDDGPSRYTDSILDLLEQHNARATFVVLGNLIESRSETVLRASSLGNEIIGHTWNHNDLTKLTEDEIRAEILDTAAMITHVTGVSRPLFRPPYGAYNDTVKEVAKELGFSIINWSVDTLDWRHRDPDWVYDAVMNEVFDGAIILLHDIHGTTAEAMQRVIPKLISQGFQLVTVSELLYHSYGEIEAGRVYRRGTSESL